MLAHICWRYLRIGNTAPNGNAPASCYWREADVGALSNQIELALFYDGRLVLT